MFRPASLSNQVVRNKDVEGQEGTCKGEKLESTWGIRTLGKGISKGSKQGHARTLQSLSQTFLSNIVLLGPGHGLAPGVPQNLLYNPVVPGILPRKAPKLCDGCQSRSPSKISGQT